MKGLYLDELGLRFRDDLDKPGPPEHGALIRVERAGICSTDLQLIDGLYDFRGVPGHEFVGVVEALGANVPNAAMWQGRRVVGSINLACNECDLCQRGLARHCRNRRVLGIRNHPGAFAEYLTLPVNNLSLVPPEISPDSAVLAEPLAAALDVLAKAELSSASQVAIIGDGRLAQLIARVILSVVDCVTVFGKHASKLARLPAACVTHETVPAGLSRHFDLVIECSGSATGMESALRLVRPAGQVIVKSTFASPLALDTEALVVNEVKLVGSRCGDIGLALDYLSSAQKKDQSLARLVDAHFRLEEGLSAFDYVRRTAAIKVVLHMA